MSSYFLENTPIPSQKIFGECRILIVGDVMLDRYWYGDVDRISPEAPVPVVRITREENRLGGCANVAYNVASLGAQSSLLSVVGTMKRATCWKSWWPKLAFSLILVAMPSSTPPSNCV